MTTTTSTDTIAHWVDGALYEPAGSATAPVTNPATGATTGAVLLADAPAAARVIGGAAAAAPGWAATSLARRTQIVFRFRELLNARKDELARIITSEHGKVHSDALGEVSRGQEVVEFACGISHLLRGGFSPSASTGVDVHSRREPLGVVGIISPFNFPAMVPMWFFPIAIAAGNAVVLKPSEKAPSAALWLARLWQEAGLPDGVFNVLHGDKAAVDALLDSPDVAAISFVGSTPVAEYVYTRASAHGKRVQALGGAKNHMVVLPDADLDLAADAAVSAGYGSAGERCMAISVLVAVDPIGDELVARIAERTRGLVTGDGAAVATGSTGSTGGHAGTDRESDMGPLVTRAHRDRVADLVAQGEAAGAKLVVDGRGVEPRGDAAGFWLGPTLFDQVTPDMPIYAEEIFGPVLSVVRVPSYAAALELVNGNPYGNGTAIFTADGGAARRFENEVRVGMIGVNVPIPVPVAYYSFGGWKRSLFGDTHAHGTEGVHFFTRAKVVTSRWPDPASRSGGGLQLGFPQNA
ncbi:methylmalonate-semialdehyde dehydrogenase (acylating) [Frankia sp. CcI49]|uniref:CoA-acylating methylmalonate-semialdehyde dehydrogenase n=1 Tax=Frankia sp. CcI49 TaxID=1745382 RepID=UPI000975C42E|nr:CoA-acylating methylmalonate-semialdehyde dehydrogenase [Frankia sp. CcI49]ONH60098.1 methylmalonate-semialdehyde dehydrogenase (acylating) [Frankia sp. CcI49]